MIDAIHAQNRKSWNAVVPIHQRHRGDLVSFFQAGGTTLFEDERALLGDLQGQTIAHLCCNNGQDSVSLALQGAQVVGVDLSDVAIDAATALAQAVGVEARFVCADVHTWMEQASAQDQQFDTIYAAYGVICWLHDLTLFAQHIARLLRPGGRVVLLEFHPVSNMFDSEWQHTRSYPHGGTRLNLAGVGDYVGASEGGLTPAASTTGPTDFQNPEPCVLFHWGVGDVVTAFAQAGLQIEQLREYLHVNGERPFSRMQPDAARRMVAPPDVPAFPLMYGLTARRSEEERR